MPALALTHSPLHPRRGGEGEGLTLVVFFKTDCPTSPLVMPYVERIHLAFGDAQGFQVLGLSQDDRQVTQAFVQENDLTFPILLDEGWTTSTAWGLEAVPTQVLINEGGRVVASHAGLIKAELNALAATIAEHLGREPVVVAPEDDGVPAWRPG